MRKPPPLPAPLAGRSFTLDEQRSAGVAAQRAWRRDLRVASRGVRVPWGAEQDFAHTCRLLCGLCPSTACCLGTAGRLWRCPLPWSVQTDLRVHLARFDGGNRPVRKGVAGHRLELPGADVTELNGIPVTRPARTWLDLATVLELEDLVVAADFFICSQSRSFGPRKLALCSMADLQQEVATNRGAPGIRRATAALGLTRVGSDSAPETRLRLALGRLGLPEPALGYVITDETGWELAWPDLAFPEFRVAVNYDGRHHLEPRQRESDIRRDESIAAIGWTSVTITALQVRTWGFDGCAQRVLDALVRCGWRAER
jgi:hypothetical protein